MRDGNPTSTGRLEGVEGEDVAFSVASRKSQFIQTGSCADLVDEFGRVHISSCAPESTPTVLTKLKKWADYESVGKPVHPTKFLPMKTPMSTEIIDNWSLDHPPKHTWTIRELVEGQKKEHNRQVGLIIDLANHDCLYIDDLLSHNRDSSGPIIEYVHVGLVAKELPPQEVIDQVEQVAQEFWSRKPDCYICLHCCYGFNRTGYVLCSYLCQVHGMSVEESLASFGAARPPGVKHKKFIEALHARYRGSERPIDDTNDTIRGSSSAGGVKSGHTLDVVGVGMRYSPGASCLGEDSNSDDGSEQRDPSSRESSPCATPPGSTIHMSNTSRPIGILTRSAPSSMRRMQLSWPESSEQGNCSSGECDTNPEAARSYQSTGGIMEDLNVMADTLKFNASMRREVHLGLAKALHDDFGQHDFHESELQLERDSDETKKTKKTSQ
jgi:hypothetical protein